MTCRNYKHFFNEAFLFDVKNGIIEINSKNSDLEFDRFKAVLDEVIQRHAPIKSGMFE